ncbi:8209_t:CDS:2, partial [Funneliformis mosseae]
PRSRSGTPEQQPSKKQNTLQTTKPERKGKEVLIDETTLVVTSEQALINVNDTNDASEIF